MSKTGEVMIEKHWRGITPRNVCDFFWDEVNRHDVPEAVPPILQVTIPDQSRIRSRSCVRAEMLYFPAAIPSGSLSLVSAAEGGAVQQYSY